MDISSFAKDQYDGLFSDTAAAFSETDPEFVERIDNFASGQVIGEQPGKPEDRLDDHMRSISILATLIGCKGMDVFKSMAPAALDNGSITPVELKEIVYQSVDYCGIGIALPFLKATNEILQGKGVSLPLPGQATTTMETRLEKGVQAQVEIFGEPMRTFYQSGPEGSRHLNRWLATNCFGDFYTRKGLDLKVRELVTVCFLAAQGGCEPQLVSHIKGNLHLGTGKQFLINMISQNLPYIGYPRTLNALRCINEAVE